MNPGVELRCQRLLGTDGTLILPVDDSAINGPTGWLDECGKLLGILDAGVDAVMGFAGLLSRHEIDPHVGRIYNLTFSSVLSHHTEKYQVTSVREATRLGADAVGVHVNFTDETEGAMVALLGRVIEESHGLGLPVLAISYPRRSLPGGGDDNYWGLRETDSVAYATLVAHGARISADLGADIIKLPFVPTIAGFERVLRAADGVPVVIAGGPPLTDDDTLRRAAFVMDAGATGLSFGRAVHQRQRADVMLRLLSGIAHRQLTYEAAYAILTKEQESK